MKNTVKVENETKTIVITKAFEKKARICGTQEYKMLVNIKKENPGYEVVVVRSTSQKNTRTNNVTFKAMETYIKNHDDAEGSMMKEFVRIRDERDFSIEYKGVFGVQKWFFKQFPDLKKVA